MSQREDPAERGYLRFFYRDWHPTRFGRFWSGAWAWVSGLGLTPQILLTLQVKDRSTGRLRANILVAARYQAQRYLVSMLGNGSEWVQNVRAAGGKAFIKRGGSHPGYAYGDPSQGARADPQSMVPRCDEWSSAPPSLAPSTNFRLRSYRRILPCVSYRPPLLT